MKKRILIVAGLIFALIAAFVAVSASGSDDSGDRYLVRAVFDNAAFVVVDEDVRIGGANVGHVDSLEVSRPGEIVSSKNGGSDKPGKAVIILDITEPGFQDFREDASCTITPQSLIGEKYIDCRPTVPRRAGAELPPPLEKIPDGQPGEGQHLLPLENNYKITDVDLVNNVMRRPNPERFRIILNELGGWFSARGGDLAEAVQRANPTLDEVNRIFHMLAEDRKRLAQLTADGDRIMAAWARERKRVVGFMKNSGDAASASAEYAAEQREIWQKFPTFLREFRDTMADLGYFAEEALPVAQDFKEAAPSYTQWTEALAPFSEASTEALKSFGETSEEFGPLMVEAMPLIKTAGKLSRSGVQPMYDLSAFLMSTSKSNGFNHLMDLFYNFTAAMNGFDSRGHVGRTVPWPSNCVNLASAPESGCGANFLDVSSAFSSTAEMFAVIRSMLDELGLDEGDEQSASGGINPGAHLGGAEALGGADGDSAGGSDDGGADSEGGADAGSTDSGDGSSELDSQAPSGATGATGGSGNVNSGSGASADLLEYLLGP